MMDAQQSLFTGLKLKIEARGNNHKGVAAG